MDRARMRRLAEGGDLEETAWDSSVLGLTPAELEEMDPDERVKAAQSRIHQAADLALAITSAFGPELQAAGIGSDVRTAAHDLIKAARQIG